MNICTSAVISEEHVSTVLVVDANRERADFLCHAVGKDYPVLHASGGEEALRVAVTAKPDVILLDVTIRNGNNGIATFRELGKRPETRDIPVLIISRIEEMTDLGFAVDEMGRVPAAFLRKPITVARLREEVSLALRGSCAIRGYQEAHQC